LLREWGVHIFTDCAGSDGKGKKRKVEKKNFQGGKAKLTDAFLPSEKNKSASGGG